MPTRSRSDRPAEATEPRRGGRPTRAQAAQLDHDVRECALRLFLSNGYEATSMDAIASAAGTTKASLYARYTSKDTLFSEVLAWAVQRPDWPVSEADAPPMGEPGNLTDLEAALSAVADATLRRALDPSMVQLGRIAIAQAGRFPELARQTQSVSRWPRHQYVVDLLEHHAQTGAIELADDPAVLAEQFLNMVTAPPTRLASFGIVRGRATQKRQTDAAVQIFLRSLRPS